MGTCCSCCLRSRDGGGGGGRSRTKETEMSSKSSKTSTKVSRKLAITKVMSSPSIQIINREDDSSTRKDCKVTGHGLALAAISIEQDASYWEWHIELPEDIKSTTNMKFGVATKKDQNFYKQLKEHEENVGLGDESDDNPNNGTALMKSIEVSNNDTVGVAVQYSDLPMIQFLLNGEPLHDVAINRFRGAVYPSIYIDHAADEYADDDYNSNKSSNGDSNGVGGSEHKVTGPTATLVCHEEDFKEMSPHARFGPLIVARGII